MNGPRSSARFLVEMSDSTANVMNCYASSLRPYRCRGYTSSTPCKRSWLRFALSRSAGSLQARDQGIYPVIESDNSGVVVAMEDDTAYRVVEPSTIRYGVWL